MQPLSQFQSHQLEVIARVTPHAMAGHILNTTVLAFAIAGSVPRPQLIAWCLYSYAIALALLYRHLRSRGRSPGNFLRAVRRATAYAFFLALPWSIMVVSYLGSLSQHEELILVALAVGMAASGTILLSAIPQAAFCYMSVNLDPKRRKVPHPSSTRRSYILLGVLSLSYWWFLAALITKIKREIDERKQADISLKESEARLQEALAAGQVVAFTWDPATDLSERSQNAPKNLGLATHGLARTSSHDCTRMTEDPSPLESSGFAPRAHSTQRHFASFVLMATKYGSRRAAGPSSRPPAAMCASRD